MDLVSPGWLADWLCKRKKDVFLFSIFCLFCIRTRSAVWTVCSLCLRIHTTWALTMCILRLLSYTSVECACVCLCSIGLLYLHNHINDTAVLFSRIQHVSAKSIKSKRKTHISHRVVAVAFCYEPNKHALNLMPHSWWVASKHIQPTTKTYKSTNRQNVVQMIMIDNLRKLPEIIRWVYHVQCLLEIQFRLFRSQFMFFVQFTVSQLNLSLFFA